MEPNEHLEEFPENIQKSTKPFCHKLTMLVVLVLHMVDKAMEADVVVHSDLEEALHQFQVVLPHLILEFHAELPNAEIYGSLSCLSGREVD